MRAGGDHIGSVKFVKRVTTPQCASTVGSACSGVSCRKNSAGGVFGAPRSETADDVPDLIPAPRARRPTGSQRPISERPEAEAKRIKNYVIVKERCAFPSLGAWNRWDGGRLQCAGAAQHRRWFRRARSKCWRILVNFTVLRRVQIPDRTWRQYRN